MYKLFDLLPFAHVLLSETTMHCLRTYFRDQQDLKIAFVISFALNPIRRPQLYAQILNSLQPVTFYIFGRKNNASLELLFIQQLSALDQRRSNLSFVLVTDVAFAFGHVVAATELDFQLGHPTRRDRYDLFRGGTVSSLTTVTS